MRFEEKNHVLLVSHQGERLRIEAWGADSLRVRASRYREFTGRDWALTEDVPEEQRKAEIFISLPDGKKGDGTDSAEADTDSGELQMQSYATIQNGRLKIRVNGAGVISFYRDGKLFLREYYRNYLARKAKRAAALRLWEGITNLSQAVITGLRCALRAMTTKNFTEWDSTSSPIWI